MPSLPLLLLCLLLLATVACAQLPEGAIPVSLTGDWQVTLGPGKVTLGGREVNLAQPVALDVTPPQPRTVVGELHKSLPVFDPKSNWRKGAYLDALRAQECSTTGLVRESSVVVKGETGQVLTRGKDYELDPFWGSIGRLEGEALGADQKVFVDYQYVPERVDSIVALPDNTLKLVEGPAGVGSILPPAVPEGAVVVANLYHHGPATKLEDSNLYPLDPAVFAPTAVAPVAEKLLPRTLAKLRAGQEVKIIAWGDSVTNGGGVGSATELWYQNVFAKALGERFPQAKITMITAAWGGRNSTAYMTAPAGGEKDFVRDVLTPRADLITCEWVNDSGLSGEALKKHYSEIMKHLTGSGAEVILITPHLVRPDWLGKTSCKFDDDPRPYVRDLRQFAADNNVALADASPLWCRLWRQGLPYMTMLSNSINHPDARGQRLFVDALMALFPER